MDCVSNGHLAIMHDASRRDWHAAGVCVFMQCKTSSLYGSLDFVPNTAPTTLLIQMSVLDQIAEVDFERISTGAGEFHRITHRDTPVLTGIPAFPWKGEGAQRPAALGGSRVCRRLLCPSADHAARVCRWATRLKTFRPLSASRSRLYWKKCWPPTGPSRWFEQLMRSGAASVDQPPEPAPIPPIALPPRTSPPVAATQQPTTVLPDEVKAPESIPATPTADASQPADLPVAEPTDLSTARRPSASNDATPETLAWYLVHTKPRQEQTALTNLERQGYTCYLPQIRIEKIRRRKAEVVTEPMFPRYLFIQLDTSNTGKSWSPIRSTLGVSQLVHFGSRPAKIDDQLVELLRSREQSRPAESLFNEGDTVLITDGPFAGIEAIYQTSDAEHRSMILLDILSKPVPMRIDTASLRKAG